MTITTSNTISTTNTITKTLDASFLWESMGMEVVLLLCFLLGYMLFNVSKNRPTRFGLAEKSMAADLASGQFDLVLARAPLNVAMFSMALQALVCMGAAKEKVETYVREALSGDLLRSADALRAALQASPDCAETLVAAFAEVGVAAEGAAEDVAAAYLQGACVGALLARLPLSAKTHAKLVRDALKQHDVTLTIERMSSMRSQDFFIPAQFLAQLARLGAKMGRGKEVVTHLRSLGVSGEQLSGMIESCCKDGAVDLVERLVAYAHDAQLVLAYEAYGAQLKHFARAHDARAFQALEAMASHFKLTEATAMAVIALCAHSKDVALAEAVLAAGPKTLAVYSAVMRVYAFARLFAKTCDLYPQVLAEGLEPDAVMYGSLIKAAVESGQLELSRKFLRLTPSDIQNYMSLFRACAREKDAKKALELLQELEASAVAVDTTAYNCVLDVVFKCGDQGAAKDLFAKMKEAGYVDTISFNTLIKGLGAQVAGSVLEQMRELKLEPNQITYNSLINAAVSSGNMGQAWKYVSVMKLEGIAIDSFTVSTMMKGLRNSASRDDVDNALRLLEGGVQVDEVLVNTLVDACIRLRDVKRLTACVAAFRRSGAVPSESAYATVIRAYGHARAVEQAQEAFAEMLAHKVWPSDATVATLVEALLAAGAVAPAMQALRALRAEFPSANPASGYTVLAKGLAQRKDATTAVELLAEVQQARAESVELLNALIDAFARSGDMAHATEVFKALCASSSPNLLTYATIIKGYAVLGEMEQAIQLFTLMRKRNVQPDATVFNAILDGCARKEMAVMVDQIVLDMESSGIPPSNVTLAILVKFYCKSGNAGLAVDAVAELPAKHGFTPTEQVYASLLAGCVRCGRLEEAHEAFCKLAHPDSKAYNLLVHGYLKGDVDKAIRFAEVAMHRGMLDAEMLANVQFMARRRQRSLPAALQGAEEPSTQFHERRRQGQAWRA